MQKLEPKLTDITIEPSTLETMDYGIFEWLDEDMNLFTTTNEGWKKVPVQFVSPERSFLSKHSKEARDNSGTIVLPMIVIERTAILKELGNKGNMGTSIPPGKDFKGGSIEIARRIQQEKSSDRANAWAKKSTGQINFPKPNPRVVYEIISIPQPTHVQLTYDISIRTEYQQQMNDLVTPFLTRYGNKHSFYIERNGHRYEAFIQGDLSLDNNVGSMDEEERSFETVIQVKLFGHLIGDGPNDERPKITIRETAAEFKIQRERVIFGDIPEHVPGGRKKRYIP